MSGMIYAALATQLMGSISSAYGQKLQGEVEARRMEFNAAVARDNAKNAEYVAKDAKKRGANEERKHKQRVKLLVGRQRTAYGSSGVDVNFGAPADVIGETILHGEDDAATIRRNAALEAWGIKAQAAGYRAQAGAYHSAGEGAQLSGNMAAGTTLLTGISSTAMNYAMWKNSGKTSGN